MIEESEKLKSAIESKAEHLADRLVPYTFLGTGAVWLLTRNVTKTLAVLMVDFSCALKLAMPITVLSALRESNSHSITVKGGKVHGSGSGGNDYRIRQDGYADQGTDRPYSP